MTAHATRLERFLIAEADYTEAVKNTRAARRLQEARGDLLEYIREVGGSGDLALIVKPSGPSLPGTCPATRTANR